ncbi:hypothetical protein QFZ45_002096 [Pseudomonas synxantha]|nr:hypothetical protein [Pseudomonas synxantha]
MLEMPLRIAHRLYDRAQPRLLAIAPQQAHGAGKMFAASQRVLEAQLELVLAHMSRHQVFNRPPYNLTQRINQLLQEVGIRPLYPPLGIERQAQHFVLQALLDLQQARQVFAKSGQLLFQAGIEHRAPMGKWAGRLLLHRRCRHFLNSALAHRPTIFLILQPPVFRHTPNT